MESLSAVISYLEVGHWSGCRRCSLSPSPQLLADEANFSAYQLQSVDLAHHLRLDGSAARALSLDTVPGEPASCSLPGLLNKCLTPQGQRLLPQWLKQPLIDQSSIGEQERGV